MLRRWLIAFLVVLALSVNVGCGAGLEPEARPFAVFSPAEDLDADTRDAVRDWSVATGLDLRVAPGGIPVYSVPQALDGNGDPACAITATSFSSSTGEWMRVDLIELSADVGWCQSTALRLRHEIGHAIDRCKQGTPGHAARGLMAAQPKSEDTEIDGDALAVVCACAPCN